MPGAIGVAALCGATGKGEVVVGGVVGEAGVPGGRPGGGPLLWEVDVLGAFGAIAPDGAIGRGGATPGLGATAPGSKPFGACAGGTTALSGVPSRNIDFSGDGAGRAFGFACGAGTGIAAGGTVGAGPGDTGVLCPGTATGDFGPGCCATGEASRFGSSCFC